MKNITIKKASFFLFTIILLFNIIILSGCNSNNKLNKNTSTTDASTTDSSKEIFDSYYILLDDSFIYFTYTSYNCVTFYRHYFKDNSFIEIGSVQNFIISLEFKVMIENDLYFYITLAEDTTAVFERNEYENIIYSIDIDNNTIQKISSDSEYLPGAIIHSCKDKIVIRQSKRSADNMLTTFIEIFNVKSKKVLKKSDEHVLNDNTNVGSYIMNICTYDSYIYALIDERFENGGNKPSVNVFDDNFNLVRTINMDSISDYIMSSRVGNMEVYDNFIFMSNYSNLSYIGIIENDTIKPLIEERNIDIAPQYSESYPPTFFIRSSNKVLTLDCENKKLGQTELELPDDYIIKYMMSTENDLLITLFAYSSTPYDKKDDLIFFLKKNSLGSEKFNNSIK